MRTYAELEKLVKNFDFSTLKFNSERAHPIFYNANRGIFEVWGRDTDIESTEGQSSVVYVGHLLESEAKNGGKPFIKAEKERIMLHITKELV